MSAVAAPQIVTCDKCHLVQFPLETMECRRCDAPLIVDIEDPISIRIIKDLQPSNLAIVGLICDGLKNKLIADMFGTSEQTIKNKVRNVYDATGMSSRLELAMFVLKHPMLREASNRALEIRISK